MRISFVIVLVLSIAADAAILVLLIRSRITLQHLRKSTRNPIALDEEQFRALVAGGVTTLLVLTPTGAVTLTLALSDIGFGTMRQAIADAEKKRRRT